MCAFVLEHARRALKEAAGACTTVAPVPIVGTHCEKETEEPDVGLYIWPLQKLTSLDSSKTLRGPLDRNIGQC
jgi:hypothetical protein